MPTPLGAAISAVANSVMFMVHGYRLIRSQQILDNDKPVVWEKPID